MSTGLIEKRQNVNVFDDNRSHTFKFALGNGGISEKVLRPAPFVKFANRIQGLIEKRGLSFSKRLAENERAIEEGQRAVNAKIYEALVQCENDLKAFEEKMSPEEFDSELLKSGSDVQKLQDLIDDYGRSILEEKTKTDALRLNATLQTALTSGTEVLVEVLDIVFNYEPGHGFSKEIVENISIPQYREIWEKFKELNDWDYIVNFPVVQKLLKQLNLAPQVSGHQSTGGF